MEDIEINLNENPDKRTIGEEEWSKETETLASEWGKKSLESSAAHTKAGLKAKQNHAIFGLPSVLIPIAMAPISTTLAHEEGIQYVNMSAFLISGILGAVDNFFQYDRKHQKHMDFSAEYSDLATDVKHQLAKARKYRISADEFLMKIQMKYDALNRSAPDL